MQFNIINSEQALIFLYSLILGAGLGVFYEIFRILRIAFKPNAIALFIQDVIFFAALAGATFVFLLAVNDGKPRWFLLFGEGSGFAAYYFTIGKLVSKIAPVVIGAINKFLDLLFLIFIKPFIIFSSFLKRRLFSPAWRKVKKSFIKFKNNVKFSLKKHRLLVYNSIIDTRAKAKIKRKKIKLSKDLGANEEKGPSEPKKERKKI
ncbi:MAG: spore cortex biosynthesis protein YabQ [Oscillospiraceae bacterium]|jgi:spore cortex biosynthesis protein YabQ|nr:spore cortex biosynthesis protein YabQ [Oscillospiraceae bacterium]